MVGNCSDDVVYRIWELRRSIDPMATGRANEMPSKERKRTGPCVNMLALANPSYLYSWVRKKLGVPIYKLRLRDVSNYQRISFYGHCVHMIKFLYPPINW